MKKRIIDLVVVLCLISFTFGCNKDDNNDINGKQWYDLGSIDVNRFAVTLCSDPDGNIYAAGQFTDPLGNYAVAQWNGSGWRNLGNGFNGTIRKIITDKTGKTIGLATMDDLLRVLFQGNETTVKGKIEKAAP